MTNLTIMTLKTALFVMSVETLDAWVADAERTCGKDSITATEARYLVANEKVRRAAASGGRMMGD